MTEPKKDDVPEKKKLLETPPTTYGTFEQSQSVRDIVMDRALKRLREINEKRVSFLTHGLYGKNHIQDELRQWALVLYEGLHSPLTEKLETVRQEKDWGDVDPDQIIKNFENIFNDFHQFCHHKENAHALQHLLLLAKEASIGKQGLIEPIREYVKTNQNKENPSTSSSNI